jgi:EAL domain-containing protein (putative c-di-GMP-specific phosphodiesterase class I)
MRVVAEGVENRTQLSYLREMECGFGQGYYFFKPLEEAAAEKLLAARSRTESHIDDLVLMQ